MHILPCEKPQSSSILRMDIPFSLAIAFILLYNNLIPPFCY
nr:MAG TPA: hypothetical protein [Bacteriophage sp.]